MLAVATGRSHTKTITHSMGPMSVPPGTSDKKYMLPDASWPTLQLELMPLNELGTNEVPGTIPGMTLSAFQLLPVPILLSDSGLNEVPMPNPRDIGVPLHAPGVPPENCMSPAPMRLLPRKLLKPSLPKRGLRMGTAAGMIFIAWSAEAVCGSIRREMGLKRRGVPTVRPQKKSGQECRDECEKRES